MDASVSDPSDAGDDGLIAHYPMDDEIVDSVVVDVVGGHGGLCVSCPTVTTGAVGQAYLFDGVDDHIRVTDFAELHAEAWTVTVWVRVDDDDPSCIISKPFTGDDVTDNSFLLMRDIGGLALFETTDDQLYSGAPFPQGSWVHVAGVWDGTEKRLYIDGIPVATSVPVPVQFDDRDVLIGIEEDDVLGIPLTGAIDDVRIYDHALDSGEIETLAAGPSFMLAPPSSPIP